MSEHSALTKTKSYLHELGYGEESIAVEYRAEYGQIVDAVVFVQGRPAIVVEVARTLPLSERTFRFHPAVRQLQFHAIALHTPFYILTDGASFLWFQTDSSGRPSRLKTAVSPAMAAKTLRESADADAPRRSVERALRDVYALFMRHGPAPLHDSVVTLYAQVMYERGFAQPRKLLLRERNPISHLGRLQLADTFTRQLVERKYYREAFELLDRVAITALDPRDALQLIDQVFLSTELAESPVRLPRWFTDFLVRLGRLRASDVVLDMFTGRGNVAAAVRLRSSVKGTNLRALSANNSDAIWTSLQQLVIAADEADVTVVAVPPPKSELTSGERCASVVIAAPPFGLKVPAAGLDGAAYRHSLSEDAYLALALDTMPRGGRLVMTVPDGLLLSPNRHSLREVILRKRNILAIIGIADVLPYSSVRMTVLVFDDTHATREPGVFVSQVHGVGESDSFDCGDIGNVGQVVRLYDAWIESPETFNSSRGTVGARVFPRRDLDASNLSATHYLAPTEDLQELAVMYPLVPLGDITELQRGAAVRRVKAGRMPFIGPGAIRAMSVELDPKDRTTKEDGPTNIVVVKPGDVVINAISTHRGSAAVVEAVLDGLPINRHVILARPEPSRILPEYLAIALNSRHVQNQLGAKTTGSTIPLLSLANLHNVLVPTPALSVQARIVDNVRNAYTRFIAARERAQLSEAEWRRVVDSLGEEGGGR